MGLDYDKLATWLLCHPIGHLVNLAVMPKVSREADYNFTEHCFPRYTDRLPGGAYVRCAPKLKGSLTAIDRLKLIKKEYTRTRGASR